MSRLGLPTKQERPKAMKCWPSADLITPMLLLLAGEVNLLLSVTTIVQELILGLQHNLVVFVDNVL